jgi:uncharacterized membrane protein YcaP (DUF421 family)
MVLQVDRYGGEAVWRRLGNPCQSATRKKLRADDFGLNQALFPSGTMLANLRNDRADMVGQRARSLLSQASFAMRPGTESQTNGCHFVPLAGGGKRSAPMQYHCRGALFSLWEMKLMTLLFSGTAHDMFVLTLPIAEKMLRPAIVYVFLVVALRVFGKRELAQLNPFDLVVLLSLSNTVQNAIIGEDNSVTGGLIGAFTLLAVNYLVVRFLFRHRRLDQIVEGASAVLIENGHVRQQALAKELLTEPELLTVAHRQGFKNLGEIERCVLEPCGTFFIEAKTPPIAERQHAELLAELEQIKRQLEQLSHR